MSIDHAPKPILDPEIQARRERTEQLLADIENGKVTDVKELDPRATSPEVVQQARARLRQLGHLASKESVNGL